MTREEATLTLKVAQEYFDKNVPVFGGEAMRMAIDALHAQQITTKLDRSQWEGCEWCTDKSDWSPLVSYCSNCGRPLTEEAWTELERRIGGCNGTTD